MQLDRGREQGTHRHLLPSKASVRLSHREPCNKESNEHSGAGSMSPGLVTTC